MCVFVEMPCGLLMDDGHSTARGTEDDLTNEDGGDGGFGGGLGRGVGGGVGYGRGEGGGGGGVSGSVSPLLHRTAVSILICATVTLL